MMTAVLDSPLHPEYGGVTVPLPIPREEYDHTMELLENLGIGDTLRQDCRIIELNSKYSVLESLAGSEVNRGWRASERERTSSFRLWDTSWASRI